MERPSATYRWALRGWGLFLALLCSYVMSVAVEYREFAGCLLTLLVVCATLYFALVSASASATGDRIAYTVWLVWVLYGAVSYFTEAGEVTSYPVAAIINLVLVGVVVGLFAFRRYLRSPHFPRAVSVSILYAYFCVCSVPFAHNNVVIEPWIISLARLLYFLACYAMMTFVEPVWDAPLSVAVQISFPLFLHPAAVIMGFFGHTLPVMMASSRKLQPFLAKTVEEVRTQFDALTEESSADAREGEERQGMVEEEEQRREDDTLV